MYLCCLISRDLVAWIDNDLKLMPERESGGKHHNGFGCKYHDSRFGAQLLNLTASRTESENLVVCTTLNALAC